MPTSTFTSDSVIYGFTGANNFLSNVHPAPLRFSRNALAREIDVDDGITYPTVEHAFQAAKTHDRAERMRIAALPKPGQAKHAGRRLPLRADWEVVKDVAMLEALRAKFARRDVGEDLASMLLQTDPRELVWANTFNSRLWGVDFRSGAGENRLGVLLMLVCTEISV